MKFFADIQIMPLKELPDHQGHAVAASMPHLGLNQVEDVRIGKRIEMTFEAASEQEANEQIQLACEKLLANTIAETFTFSIQSIAEESTE